MGMPSLIYVWVLSGRKFNKTKEKDHVICIRGIVEIEKVI